MIKVNLLRNRVEDTGTQQQVYSQGTETRDALVKLALILLCTAGLMVYESSYIGSLTQRLSAVNEQLSQLQSRRSAVLNEVNATADVESRAKELEDKLKLLKLLSKLRLREVKTLDFMQSSIPDRVWLRSVKYQSATANPDEGQYEFQGNAVLTEDLTQFVQRLEQSAYLSNVIVVKDQEYAASGHTDEPIRDFQFIADVENQK